MFRNLVLIVALSNICSCDEGRHLTSPTGSHGTANRGVVNGSGNVVTESRELAPFHAVSFRGIGHLVIDRSAAAALTITAEDNIQPLLMADVVDGTLSVGLEPDVNIGRVGPIEFRLSASVLRELSVSGATSVDASNIDVDRLDVVISGANTVTMAGRADEQDIVVLGASTYLAAELESRIVAVDANGASSVIVRVSDELTARVRGASRVAYIGTPNVHVDGPSGFVHPQ